MPNFCHGKGNPESDGCCWVNGSVCPLRLKIENGRVYDNFGNDLGTINTYTATKFSGARLTRARNQFSGPRIVCRAAVEVLANDNSLLSNRGAFNAAWNSHTDYVILVRPHWAAIEQTNGLTPGSYQCSTWGPPTGECCFSEDSVTNSSKGADLNSSAVSIRKALTN